MAPSEFDPSTWSGRCVIARGYAHAQKIGPLLDMGGPTIGVILAGDGDWSVPLGSRVEVEGTIVERSDLPVFVPDPNEPIVQGIPVEPGTDLEQARRRWVIEATQVRALSSPAEIEAALADRVGQQVVLPGVVWSRNNAWWFEHEGLAMHMELGAGLDYPGHGQATQLRGRLERRVMPRIDQLGISAQPDRAEAFVIIVEGFEAHAPWPVVACPGS